MELRPWQLLPDEMRTKEVRKYYNILMKHRMWLEMKRVLDVIVAGIMLAVLIIPMGIIALAIRLDSPGPVFFRQARVTQYGRIFRIYKFRTMVDNASKLGAAVTVDNDSRITKVGAFLRKYRMDEFPQLFNILAGDMTLVGTRPEVPKYVKKYTKEMYATLLLPAGLTSRTSIAYKDEDKLLGGAVDEKIEEQIISDIRDSMNRKTTQNNKQHLYNMDSRVGIENEVQDNTIDLVITSPPYLNSRDYTDTYMLELKTLGFTDSAAEIRKLREKTLRSHVQIKWEDDTQINNVLLTETLRKLESASENIEQWNDSIIDMVRLYFVDMKKIFCVLYKKMKQNGRVYFNVSNSAYFNVLIDTLEICASIAEQEGFKVIEIRDARKLKTSPQQQEKVGKLLEGVIVLER